MDQETLFAVEPVKKKGGSKPWRSPKVRQVRADVQAHVDHISAALTAQGLTHYFGGSWRRESATVGDLDVLVVAQSTAGIEIPGYIVHKGKDIAMQGDITVNDLTIHLDVWTCKPKELGAYLAYFTGPKELNVAMRRDALKQGKHLKQQGLLDDEGTQYDDGTERGVFAALGWEWIEPKDREKWATPAPKIGAKKAVKVLGSKGDTYTLTAQSGKVTCTCPGFTYRRKCKHVTNAADYGLGI